MTFTKRFAEAAGLSNVDPVALEKFAAFVRINERAKNAGALITIADGYGTVDRGLSDQEYGRMRQTALEHAVAVWTQTPDGSIGRLSADPGLVQAIRDMQGVTGGAS